MKTKFIPDGCSFADIKPTYCGNYILYYCKEKYVHEFEGEVPMCLCGYVIATPKQVEMKVEIL